jgi:hypothetical protein
MVFILNEEGECNEAVTYHVGTIKVERHENGKIKEYIINARNPKERNMPSINNEHRATINDARMRVEAWLFNCGLIGGHERKYR